MGIQIIKNKIENTNPINIYIDDETSFFISFPSKGISGLVSRYV